MKTLLAIIASIAVPILVVFLAYYLNKEKAELRYTLSESIPTELLAESSAESIQQLTIKNTGSVIARKIQIKITDDVCGHDIVKYSATDSVEIVKSKGYFEMIYPELPPQGDFKVVLKSSGGGIDKSDLDITYDKGKAVDALAEKGTDWTFITFLALAGVYFLLSLSVFRASLIENLESKARNYGQEEILRKKKPLYVGQEKWHSIRQEALTSIFTREYYSYSEIEKMKSYKFLNYEKPNYLNKEEWNTILENALQSFCSGISSVLNRAFLDSIEKLFQLKKPQHVPEIKWNELMEDINERYFAIKKDNILQYRWIGAVLEEINSDKPSGANEKHWNDWINFAKKLYFLELSRELELSSEPMKFLDEQNLDALPEKEREEIVKRSHQLALKNLPDVLITSESKKFLDSGRPDWMDDEEYRKYEEKAQALIEVDILKEKYAILISLFESILRFQPISKDKPNALSKDDWEKLKQIEREITISRENNVKESEELSKQKEIVDSLKERIECQLSIIHLCLNDPTILDRIEEYSNAFAPGNFENLKKISILNQKLNS